MTVSEVLKAGREKIADEKHWTQGEVARDKDGAPVSKSSLSAVCWCATGAVTSSEVSWEVQLRVVRVLDILTCIKDSDENDLRPLAIFNDTHTHAEVLALFDKAIAAQETKLA